MRFILTFPSHVRLSRDNVLPKEQPTNQRYGQRSFRSRQSLSGREKIPHSLSFYQKFHCCIHSRPSLVPNFSQTSSVRIARHTSVKASSELLTAKYLLTHNATVLTFWRRIFFQILAHPVFKMWVIQKPNKVALWNKRYFEEKKCRLYSMFKMFSTDICWINIKWGI